MFQVMESWFVADVPALREYYGKHFQESAIPRNSNIEQILKQDVMDSLKAATRNCPKGAYHKTAHPPDLLERINPELVRKGSPQCERMFDTVLSKLSEGQQ